MSDKHQDSLSLPGRCRSCMETWPCEVERLAQERDALAVALESTRKALQETLDYAVCVEHALSPWVASRPGMAKYPDGAAEIGERARAVLAADQPAAAGAELLAAAEAMREALVRLTPGPYIGAMSGPESEGVRALKLWDRAKAGQRAAGPGRESE